MTQENEDLLLKDLCARLPYSVKIHAKCFDIDTNTDVEKVGVLSMIDTDTVVAFTTDDTGYYIYVTIHEVKPYLFPLSSMTEEQRKEYEWIIYRNIELHCERYYNVIDIDEFDCLMDFYHKYHFDYRGLIPMGLAIDATGLNIY